MVVENDSETRRLDPVTQVKREVFVAEERTTFSRGNDGFFAKNKKAVIGVGVILFLLFVLLLGLGLGGVLTPDKTTPKPTSPTRPTTPVDPTSTPPSPPTIPSTTTPALLKPPQARLDCKPDKVLNKVDCEAAGCVYDEKAYLDSPPKCFQTAETAPFFKVQPLTTSLPNSELYELVIPTERAAKQLYSEPFGKPQLLIEKKSNSILHFKFLDGSNPDRYEVPVPLQELKDSLPNAPKYSYELKGDTKGFKIRRDATGTVIWDLSLGGLVLEDQFLQITTKLPSTYVYGFGDNRHPNLRHKMDWRTWPMFSRDEAPTNENATANLYGVHPFYMCIEEDGNAHGVFLFNSNAMEYQFQPAPALTLRSIGGVLDFYVFMGPTPENVVQQYTELLGRMFIPPYWGLGFQISRWGFEDLNHVKKIVKMNVDAGIPLDSVYGDIDYMRHRQDFTYDQDKYAGLPEYIDEIHKAGMRYVIILDPAIHVDSDIKHPNDTEYLPYIRGMKDDIFIKWPAAMIDNITLLNNDSIGFNRAMLGKVWPDGRCAFPDFFRNSTLEWWDDMINHTYNEQKIKFDALWIE